MDNWENNIIANKLNSLQDLPEGYKPNLASKWEIIEAGLPKEKRIVPLFKWSIAAAVFIGIVLIKLSITPSFNKQTIASQLLHTEKHFTSIESLAFKSKQKTIADHSINLNITTKNKLINSDHLNKQLPSNHPNKKLIFIDTTPVLASIQQPTAVAPATIATPTLITLQTIQIKKSFKHKIYQKDFNDNSLKIEDINTASQIKHTGFKIQLIKPATINSDPSSPVLQWQKSF